MKRYLLASLLLASACGMDDDEIWMPPTSSGKADGSTIIEGSTIPSQYVDANKHYLTGRRIDTLQQVGALAGTEDSVARRADGIIANLPANGRIEAAELARMENPAIFATLFPDEQTALPSLWKLLEAPFPVVTVNGIPSDLTITDKRVEPSGLVLPPSLTISSLPVEYQTLAKRVQLVFNADANATTIEIADIDQVLVMPQAFTPSEVEQLKQIRLIFIERATSNCEAKASVPEPGHKTATTTFGTMTLELTRDVAIRERRYLNANTWNAQLTLEADASATLTTPATGKIVAIELGTGGEYLVEDGRIGSPQSTSLIVERYDNGVRQEAHDLALPPIDTRHYQQGMQAFVDYTLELANNTPLVKYPVDTPAGSTTVVDFEYGVTAMPNPLVDLNRVAAVATPPISLPTGRYSIDMTGFGKVAMDVYPGSVVMLGGQKANPTYYSQTAERVLYVDGLNQQSTRHFTPATNELYVWWYPGHVAKTTVRGSMRTQ